MWRYIELKWLLIKFKRHLHLTTVTETYVQRLELKFMIFKGTDSEMNGTVYALASNRSLHELGVSRFFTASLSTYLQL
jgi:hypothetical protein